MSDTTTNSTTISTVVPAVPQVTPKTTINAIILEDEPNNMELLTTLLGKHCSHVNITGTGVSVADGVKLVNDPNVAIDVCFLDIRLKDGLAFEMFKYLNEVTFDVIFVTAYDEYFQQACGYYSIGYIVKPLSSEDLIKAVNKVRTYRSTTEMAAQKTGLDELLKQLSSKDTSGRFPIPTSKGYSLVELEDIIRLEGFDNYTKIYTNNETLMTSRTIKMFEKVLEPLRFHRIHKQHIINLNNMKQYLKTDSYVEMADGSKLPVAKRRKTSFLKILKASPFC